MNKFYIKTLIFALFVSMFLTQDALCKQKAAAAAMIHQQGYDINDFKKIKKIKTLFKKKSKKQSDLKFEKQDVNPDDEVFMFDGNDVIMTDPNFGSKTMIDENNSAKTQNIKETKKNNWKFFPFKKKNKNSQDIIEEETIDAVDVQQNEHRTYYDDSDTVSIKEIEIYGNNLLDVAYIKEQLTSKEGGIYSRTDVSEDLKQLYATGYFTKNIRALPIKIDNNNVKLRIIVEENQPVSGFGITGNNSVNSTEIMSILSKYEGKPLNILKINDSIDEIQEIDKRKILL